MQRYNKQYSDMLKQRLDEEVSSTSSYTLSKAVALTQARRSFVLCVHASDQDKLRAQLEEENRDACRSLSIQFENRLKKFRDEADAVHNQTSTITHTHMQFASLALGAYCMTLTTFAHHVLYCAASARHVRR